MANTVYRIREGIELNEFLMLGYDIVDNASLMKIIEIDDLNELSNYLMKKYYTNEQWIEQIYKPNKKAISKTIDLKYDKYGQIRPSKKLDQMIHNWTIIVDFEDLWLGFTSSDPFDQQVFYNKILLDTHFESEIKMLKEHNLIEEFEIVD